MKYQEIFDKRGQMYHQAMTQWPNARQYEFELPLHKLDIKPGELLVDLPSGGGYLSRFLPDGVIHHCMEPCPTFASFCQKNGLHVSQYNNTDLPLGDNTVDKLISIAGLHHIQDKRPIFSEIHRILKPGSKLCITDVEEDSDVAGFLDDVVDRYSVTGHYGYFLNRSTAQDLANAGMTILNQERLLYSWIFSSEEDLLHYCKLLFGLDNARLEDVRAGIEKYLMVRTVDEQWHLMWQLWCITATKPDVCLE